jgi:REP-associated tyrosine transposase
MPRKPRMFVPGLPAHIIQRGNNRQAIFFKASDYRRYLTLLHEARDRYGCAINAYVLMTNHVHLLLTPDETTSVSRIMQYVGRKYVPYINLKYGRSGTLWEGRFKASLVQSSRYLLACYRYIELNPGYKGVRALSVFLSPPMTSPGFYDVPSAQNLHKNIAGNHRYSGG